LIIVDTHVLVWIASQPRKLTRAASAAIRRASKAGELAIASVTVWELAVLFAAGRLKTPGTIDSALRNLLEATAVEVREITPLVAAMAAQVPVTFPRDPADRLIASTAKAEGATLVTADARIADSGYVRTIW
jgi:PIN domain nuclease of toxin-antitoxin system